MGSRDDLSMGKRVFFVKVQGANFLVLPLLVHHPSMVHHPSTSPSGGFFGGFLEVIL